MIHDDLDTHFVLCTNTINQMFDTLYLYSFVFIFKCFWKSLIVWSSSHILRWNASKATSPI